MNRTTTASHPLAAPVAPALSGASARSSGRTTLAATAMRWLASYALSH
ncbi:hypothetical protein [Imbroritus primus]